MLGSNVIILLSRILRPRFLKHLKTYLLALSSEVN